jgi:histidinol-phosphate aminotransferase
VPAYASPQLPVAARLNTNECPFPLPDGFFDDLSKAVHELALHRYPDGAIGELRRELAVLHGHAFDGTWVANGSNEVLLQLLQAYGGAGRRVVTFEPTYLLHGRLGWLTQTEVVRLMLGSDFRLGAAQVRAAEEAVPDVVFVCSPNNPTGNAQPVGAIRSLAEALPEALVIVDEAYGEFSAGSTALPLVRSHPNVVVVRTFSKAFALAGARLGYTLSAPTVVEDLERVRLPYHVSALTQAAGLVALRHRDEALAILDRIREQRDRIAVALAATPGVAAFPTDANFVLFRVDAAAEIWQRLLDRGVLVRDMTAVVPETLRVTAGTPEETGRFLDAFQEVMAA